jgi:hypothetical protein
VKPKIITIWPFAEKCLTTLALKGWGMLCKKNLTLEQEFYKITFGSSGQQNCGGVLLWRAGGTDPTGSNAVTYGNALGQVCGGTGKRQEQWSEPVLSTSMSELHAIRSF